MNISYLKNKNIHFVECENWHDAYGYEKSEMKEDTINYIEKLQQENKQLKEIIKENTILVKDEYGNYQECNIKPLEMKQKYEKLKDNWNKLKEYCKENTLCYEVGDNENTKLIGSKIHGLNVLDKMQELEQGSDE